MAAQGDPDLVARPDQRGHGQKLHDKVEVLPGRDRQAVSPGEAPGHPEPRGLGRPGRRAVDEPQAAFGHVGHLTVWRDVLEIGVDRPVGS